MQRNKKKTMPVSGLAKGHFSPFRFQVGFEHSVKPLRVGGFVSPPLEPKCFSVAVNPARLSKGLGAAGRLNGKHLRLKKLGYVMMVVRSELGERHCKMRMASYCVRHLVEKRLPCSQKSKVRN